MMYELSYVRLLTRRRDGLLPALTCGLGGAAWRRPRIVDETASSGEGNELEPRVHPGLAEEVLEMGPHCRDPTPRLAAMDAVLSPR